MPHTERNQPEESRLPSARPLTSPDMAGKASAPAAPLTPAVSAARTALERAERVIIVTKFRFMGDTLVATPFFRQLRAAYPRAAITLLTSPTAATALANCPYLDTLSSLSMQGVSRWKHSRELLAVLRQGRYDVAFLLNRSLHCAAICAFARVPARIGYDNEHRRGLLTLPIPYFFDRNEVDSSLDMLRALALPVREELPELWITSEEADRAQRILIENGAQSGTRLRIGVQPGANDSQIREWGAERFAHVAETLAKEMGAQIVLMGGAAEAETAARMAKALSVPPVSLVGKLSLREALATVAQCNLWLGNDTGLLHAAVALRVPSVGIFGPNKIVRWGYESARHRSLTHFPEVPARDDASVRRALDAISEAEVLQAAQSVLRAPAKEMFETPPYFAATRPAESLAPAPRR